MSGARSKDLSQPDEIRTFPNGRVELFNMGGMILSRTTFEPGWHWAVDVKPIVGTSSCEIHHLGIVLSGTLGVRTDDGVESVIRAGSAYDIPPGHDGWVIGDEPWITFDFFGMENFAAESDDQRVLMSILFTDIVGSTEIASRIGDVGWRELLARYNPEARLTLERYRAKTAQDTGDGVMALFDNPARAVNCAVALGDLARTYGIALRAGVHTGDVQLSDNTARGVAVHEAARVAGLAGAGDVFVSAATRALLAGGPTLRFESRGMHELKGIEGVREIFALLPSASSSAPTS